MTRDALEKLLASYGLEMCGECLSWINATKTARSFHYRRCAG